MRVTAGNAWGINDGTPATPPSPICIGGGQGTAATLGQVY